MTSRSLLVLLLTTGIWACCCFPAGIVAAATGSKLHTVAMITWRGDTPAELGFMEGLQQFGYNFRCKKYSADQKINQLHEAIAALEKDKVDLIYVFGTTATKHILQKIKETPVVFNIVTRPVESGIIANWESSGNNATGVSSMVPIIHQLETLKKVINFSTLGIIYNPREQNSVIQKDIIKGLEATLNFRLVEFRLTSATGTPQILASLSSIVDAVYLPSDSMVKILGKEIMAVVNAQKIPSLSAMEDMVEKDSALIGLVPDYYQLGLLAAEKAHLIFQGENPSQIPTSTLGHFNITVNMNTAKQAGINIPTSILVIADKIIR